MNHLSITVYHGLTSTSPVAANRFLEDADWFEPEKLELGRMDSHVVVISQIQLSARLQKLFSTF